VPRSTPPRNLYPFEPATGALSDAQAVFWKSVFVRSLKVGIELEVVQPEGVDRDAVMAELTSRLRPSRDNRRLGENGVLTISRELVGLEIKVVGRVPIFEHLLRHLRVIFHHTRELGCEPSGACGMHNHLLAVQLGEDVPSLVLANLWNLTRWHAPALRFLTSGGPRLSNLTRRSSYCDHAELMRLDPRVAGMREIKTITDRSREVRAHDNFLNIEHVAFAGPDFVSAFHLEFRFPDMDTSPIAVVAKAFLFCALTLRAIELSKYGLLVPDAAALQERAALLDRLSNVRGPESLSDTSDLQGEGLQELRRQARELVVDLRSVCSYFDPKVYRILGLLALTPTSILRDAGNDWESLDAVFAAVGVDEPLDDPIRNALVKEIELMRFMGRPSLDGWFRSVSSDLDVSVAYLRRLMRDLGPRRQASWDEDLGTVVFQYR
jgi:hypothetical protein